MALQWKPEQYLTLHHLPRLYLNVWLKVYSFHAHAKEYKSRASLVYLTTLPSNPSLVSPYLQFTLPSKKFKVIAVVMPRVTCDLPLHPVSFDLQWRHLEGIPLADPNFGLPGRVDILLGVEHIR